MQAPYQCLQRSGRVLFAASGSRLDSFNLDDGTKISSWSCPLPQNAKKTLQSEGDVRELKDESSKNVDEMSDLPPVDVSGPPAKRRKVSDETESAEKTNGNSEKGKRHKGRQYPAPRNENEAPVFAALTCANGGTHVIAITGEDKTIRVFEHDMRGNLTQLSERVMPKRPCALAITSDGTTIISADKFGDVYSLPLLGIASTTSTTTKEEAPEVSSPAAEPLKPFVSAANDLTVHSVRNRKALQNQLRQNQRRSEKPDAHPGQELLLGHVSMLTDVVTLEDGERSYIVTADRDEHIRISRGIPQAHIIENFCMGHTEFVSRLCFPSSHPSLLVSGGGDDEVFFWNWQTGQLLQRTDLRRHVEEVMSTILPQTPPTGEDGEVALPEPLKIAVSAIQHIGTGSELVGDTVVVTCEGIPAIFFFDLSGDQGLPTTHQTLVLEGNPLAFDVNASIGSLVVSIDCVHEAGSITQIRQSEAIVEPLQIYELMGSEWQKGEGVVFKADSVGKEASNGSFASLSGWLYNLENLRKRGGDELGEE